MAAAPGARQQLDLNTLTSQQLLSVKKQLDTELEHLNNSYTQLRLARDKFAECLRTLDEGLSQRSADAQILVPLTTSLYVPGTLASVSTVLVDVGTGFYVEKSTQDAQVFYKEKAGELGTNLSGLEGVMQGKAGNLRMVEDVLRQKVAQEQAQAKAGTANGA